MERLRKRVDFLAAAAGPKVPAAAFVLQAHQRANSGPPRVGFAVSKKVGGAVERNRIRRRLREVVRLSDAGRLHQGNDYVLIGRRAALELPFDRLIEEFAWALERVHKARHPAHRPARQRGGKSGQVSSAGNQST